mgnify:CR=1 FL=1
MKPSSDTIELKLPLWHCHLQSCGYAHLNYNFLCCFLGSVLSGGGSVPAPQATPAVWVNMVNEFQKGALSTRLGIPMIYGIDAVHGNNNVYNATLFPHNIGLGATRHVF